MSLEMAKFTDKVKKGAHDLKLKFTAHPNERGENYCKHLLNSMCSCGKSIGVGLQYFVHGFFPCVFQKVDEQEKKEEECEEQN